MNATGPNQYTASQIALAAGLSKRTTLKALARTAPAGVTIVRGNEAPTWTPAGFPQSIRAAFTKRAAKLGIPEADFMATQLQLAVSGVQRWESGVPLSEIAETCLTGARKLRDALLPALQREHAPTLTPAERVRLGLADYKRAFGHEVTARHWRRLMDRTFQRDGSAEDFDRLDLFLPERPQRKPVATPVAPHENDFRQLDATIQAFTNPSAPTSAEKAALWSETFELYEAGASTRAEKKRLRKALVKFLWRQAPQAPGLAQNEHALRVAFDRKHERWTKADGLSSALLDGREAKAGEQRAEPISQDDVDRITFHAARNCGGRVAQAVRDFTQQGPRSGLSNATLDLLDNNSARKSYVPRRLREPVKRDVRLIRPYFLGKKAIDDATAHIQRDYSKLVSMQVVCADDFTMPVYFYVPDGKGRYLLTRGQCLVFMDVRSWKVIAWSLQPERNYNSLVIRTLMNRVCAAWGLPRVWYFERGIWKNAKLVKGDAPKKCQDALSWPEAKVGWENVGVRFVHATRARSKPVERLGGLLQNFMEGVRGYCGRDERRDCPAVTKRAMDDVQARRVNHPGELFLSFDEWNTELAGIIDRYNAESQDGETLKGLSPDEAFENYWPHNNPPARFDATCWHLVAHYVKQVEIETNGITLRKGFVYRNKRTSEDRGKQILAWFDPECPQVLCVTDLNRRNPYFVERSGHPDFDAERGDPVFDRELSNIAAHSAYPKARFHVLKAKFEPTFRRNIVDVETAETAAEIRQQRDTAAAEQKQAGAQLAKARAAYGELGATPPRHLRPESLAAAQKLKTLRREYEAEKEKPGKITYVLKPFGSGQREYVDYLVKRLTEFRAAGKSFGQKFSGAIAPHITSKIAKSQLGCDLHDESRFDDVCAYLKEKIDATILGKRNAGKGTPNYHEFEAVETPF